MSDLGKVARCTGIWMAEFRQVCWVFYEQQDEQSVRGFISIAMIRIALAIGGSWFKPTLIVG